MEPFDISNLVDIEVEFRTDLKGHTYVKNNELTFHYEFDVETGPKDEKGTSYVKYTLNTPDSKEIEVKGMIDYFNDCIKNQAAPTELGYETFVKEEIEKIKNTLVEKIKDLKS